MTANQPARRIVIEECADDGFDAVMVDAYGEVLARGYGATPEDARRNVEAMVANAKRTDWL